MTLQVRRVVTGHDAQGKSVVTHDGILPVATRRPGQQGCTVWAMEGVPIGPGDPPDRSKDMQGSTFANGVAFRVVRYEAGTAGRLHRTPSIDYAIVLSGTMHLELDDGVQVMLRGGDVLVQRGTVHNWINRSSEPCTIAFVLVHTTGTPETQERGS